MELDLLSSLPRAPRPIAERARAKREHPELIALARQFGEAYFDGNRMVCYGGYHYDGRWLPVARRIRDHYRIGKGWRVLDVGCAKAFLLHDLWAVTPGIHVTGVDISEYAIERAPREVLPNLRIGDARALPYAGRCFDLALSINTLHNLPLEECQQAIMELQRVSHHQFIQVDSWHNEQEKENLLDWSMTAQTFLSVEEWRELFARLGYTGDWFFTFIEE